MQLQLYRDLMSFTGTSRQNHGGKHSVLVHSSADDAYQGGSLHSCILILYVGNTDAHSSTYLGIPALEDS